MKTRILFLVLAATTALAQRQPIAPRPIVPIPYTNRAVTTAFAGDRFLTVWLHQKGAGASHFLGAFSDADGKRVSPAAFLIVANVDLQFGAQPQLIRMEDGYALFWRDAARVRHFVLLDLDGAVKSRATVSYGPFETQDTYAWNGTHFLGVIKPIAAGLTQTDGIEFTRDGTLVQKVLLDRRNISRAALPSGNGFLVLSAGDFGVTAQRVDATGVTSSTSLIALRGSQIIGAPTGDGGVLAVWAGLRDSKLYAARISAGLQAGTTHELWHGTEPVLFDVARTSSGFRVLAYDGRSRVFQLDEDGSLRATAGSAEAKPHVAASNERVTLAVTMQPVRTFAIRDGGEHESEIVALAPQRQSDPLLAATGRGHFLATWAESSLNTGATRAAAIDPRGQVTQPRTAANDAITAGDVLAWDGAELALLVTRQGNRLLGTRIVRNGTPLDAVPFTIADVIEPHSSSVSIASVTWHVDRWIVGWIDLDRIFTAEVLGPGYVGAPRRLDVPLPPPFPHYRSIASELLLRSNGRDVLLVFEHYFFPPCIGLCGVDPNMYVTRLGAFGQALDVPIQISEDDFLFGTALASSGDELLLLRRGQANILRTDGGIYADGWRTFFEYPGPHAIDLAWDGGEYVAAVRYGYYDAYVARFRFDRNAVMTAPPLYTLLYPADTFGPPRPAIAAQSGLDALIAVSESVAPEDTQQVSLIRESELEPFPAPPPTPQVRVQPTDLPLIVDLLWDPVPGAEGYVVEVHTGAGWYASHVLPATATSARISGRSRYRVRAFNAGGSSEPAEVVPR